MQDGGAPVPLEATVREEVPEDGGNDPEPF